MRKRKNNPNRPNNPNNKTYHEKRKLKPKTKNQGEYIRAIAEQDLTICTGPAGTGKTSIAVGLACEYLTTAKVDKIIITRPVVETGSKGLGYLPGTFAEKMHPYLLPVLEEMKIYMSHNEISARRNSGDIEICPLEYMRGRNFHNCFMILDEAQNITYGQLKMFLTRMGRNSKAVINGDTKQSDLSESLQGALKNCAHKLEGLEGVGIIRLDETDIVRSDIISKILNRLG
jgi:phosphate starvation-inducible PhoH-like protein